MNRCVADGSSTQRSSSHSRRLSLGFFRGPRQLLLSFSENTPRCELAIWSSIGKHEHAHLNSLAACALSPLLEICQWCECRHRQRKLRGTCIEKVVREGSSRVALEDLAAGETMREKGLRDGGGRSRHYEDTTTGTVTSTTAGRLSFLLRSNSFLMRPCTLMARDL